jgi:carbamoyl-phosphate synthase small subunit
VTESARHAALVLEDGTFFLGRGFGADREVSGEVVFNTGMVGYPESLTDPSYHGQILVQTWPLVGNYGVASRNLSDGFGVPLHFESSRIQVTGYAVGELQRRPSHWSMEKDLDTWMTESGIPGIEGIDTREITKKLRAEGTMLGLLRVATDIDLDGMKRRAKSLQNPNSLDLVKNVTVSRPVEYNRNGAPTVAVIDCGLKLGILRNLLARGVRVIQLPYDTRFKSMEEMAPDGVVISNGPGDPKMCAPAVGSARSLLESDVPLLGICLGTQILSLAAGGDTYKLKFGHRAQNHPCRDEVTRRVYMTTQNHGYSVDAASLEGFRVSFTNLNDGTVEGIAHESKPVLGVQFHPEASPGPYEAGFVFDNFLEEARKFRDAKR